MDILKKAEDDFKKMKPAILPVGVNPKHSDASTLKLAAASVLAFSAMMLLN